MDEMHSVVGESERMQNLIRQIRKVGKHRWPVLLLGETGSGKEVMARAIYHQDSRGPFVTVDCSAMVGTLMESELFGHARGAFTGAVVAKTGLIEMAHGGTAFFDEIGELPLDLQAKLLRVLQEKEFRAVGSPVTRRADFRVIAATNRDLAREVEKGAFRRDLYYRLNVVVVRVPSLTEREDDIPLLISHFIALYGRNHTVSEDAMAALTSYPWPGNVRELENCVKRMVAANSGPVLHTSDLPSALLNHFRAEQVQGMAMAVAAANGGPTVAPHKPPGVAMAGIEGILPLAELERREILRAIAYTKGDRVAAAALLGIGRTTLYRKLKEYEVAS